MFLNTWARARYEHSKLKIYSNWALKNSALALIKSYGMTQTCSFASIVLVVKAIRRSGDTVWAKYEYEIELRLKIVRLSIKFGFGSSTDGKMNWNIPKLLQLDPLHGREYIQCLNLLQSQRNGQKVSKK